MEEAIEDCRREYTDSLSVRTPETAKSTLFGCSHPVTNQTFFSMNKSNYRPKCLIPSCDLESIEFVDHKNEETNQWRQLHFELLQFHHLIRRKNMEVEAALCKINGEIIHGALALEVEQ